MKFLFAGEHNVHMWTTRCVQTAKHLSVAGENKKGFWDTRDRKHVFHAFSSFLQERWPWQNAVAIV